MWCFSALLGCLHISTGNFEKYLCLDPSHTHTPTLTPPQVNNYQMPFCAENVCLEVDDYGTGLYAVGSRSHVTLIDSRVASSQPPTAFRSPDKDCGVRSLNFNSGLLSMGTGAGHVYFYDLRAKSYLLEDELTYKKCFLQSTPGWLVSSCMYKSMYVILRIDRVYYRTPY